MYSKLPDIEKQFAGQRSRPALPAIDKMNELKEFLISVCPGDQAGRQVAVRELYEIYKIREDVFVVEQSCPYHEVDENDLKSLHVYALDDQQKIIAYARIFPEGDTVTFGRVLINRKYRGTGFGKELVSKLIKVIEDTAPGEKVVIEAQEYIQPLYASFGFKRTSEVYQIDNILTSRWNSFRAADDSLGK